MNLEIYVDGGARGNPGPAAAGVVIRDRDRNEPVHEGGYFLGVMTNNAAEYQGLIRSLELAKAMGGRDAAIHSDSQLMVRQVTGQYRVKSPSLKPLHDQVRRLLTCFKDWRITHVYRESNTRADELANMAMDAKRDVIITAAAPGANSQDKDPQKNPLKTASHDRRPVADDASDAESTRDLPAWAAVVISDPQKPCPTGCKIGSTYRFNASTPAGLCVYAARALLNSALSDDVVQKHQVASTQCDRCGAAFKISIPSEEIHRGRS